LTQTPQTNHSPADPAAYARFAGLVFDCDGTLADTMPAHYIAWSETVARYGLAFPEERFYALGGTPAHRVIEILAEEQNVRLGDAHAIAHEKEHAFAKHLDAIGPIEAVVAVAEAYRGQKPMAVATGGFRWLVEKSLSNIGILDWFDCLVTCEDVTGHKPEPDTYLEAARQLQLAPGDCCAFEDTDLGLQSARAAGMTAVDVREMRSD
jgi:HAD superfamily hydrolase (TIGR01509 family)